MAPKNFCHILGLYVFLHTILFSAVHPQVTKSPAEISATMLQKIITYNETLTQKDPNVATYATVIDQLSKTVTEIGTELLALFELAHVFNFKPLAHLFAHVYLRTATKNDLFVIAPMLSQEALITLAKHYFLMTGDASVMIYEENGKEKNITLSLDEVYYVKTILIHNGAYDLSHLFLSSLGNFSLKGMLIERIDLSNNKFTTIPNQLSSLPTIISVDLSHNAITTIPDFLFSLPAIKHISLSYNAIALLPSIPQNASELWRLELDHNNLISLPDSIKFCQNLAIINVSNNNLQTLPESIQTLKKLEKIDISNNKCTIFPSDLLKIPALRIINIKENTLTELPETKTCKIIA